LLAQEADQVVLLDGLSELYQLLLSPFLIVCRQRVQLWLDDDSLDWLGFFVFYDLLQCCEALKMILAGHDLAYKLLWTLISRNFIFKSESWCFPATTHLTERFHRYFEIATER